MKLNAATEMLPLSMANWGNIHPFVPIEQAEGYQTILKELADDCLPLQVLPILPYNQILERKVNMQD